MCPLKQVDAGFHQRGRVQVSTHGGDGHHRAGHLFADDAEQPRAALALTVEGYLLAGDDEDPAIIAGLRRLFEEGAPDHG